jgi:putative peptidoglycan lipid II flippase
LFSRRPSSGSWRRLAAFDDAVVMTRLMFPYIACMSLVALSAGVLNTWQRFAIPAVTPVLLNLCVIGAAWLLVPQFRVWGIAPIHALAVGVMAGGIAQLALQVPALMRIGALPRIAVSVAGLRGALSHPGLRRILQLMLPALLGVSVAQLSLLINTQIASHVGVGAVSWLTYADRLMEFPTRCSVSRFGVVLLPQLSAAQGRRRCGLLACSIGPALVVLFRPRDGAGRLSAARREPYNYGAFDPQDADDGAR